MRRFIVVCSVLGLAACGSGQAGPGGETAGEAKALDDAAEMLEQRRLPDDALRPPAAPDRQAQGQQPAQAK